MHIFIVQGGGGVGARHTIVIQTPDHLQELRDSDIDKISVNHQGCHSMPQYDKPGRIISSNPTRLEGSDGGSASRLLRRLEQSWRMYHALWLSPK
eukprot:3940306-Rhodomonas_salina.1